MANKNPSEKRTSLQEENYSQMSFIILRLRDMNTIIRIIQEKKE